MERLIFAVLFGLFAYAFAKGFVFVKNDLPSAIKKAVPLVTTWGIALGLVWPDTTRISIKDDAQFFVVAIGLFGVFVCTFIWENDYYFERRWADTDKVAALRANRRRDNTMTILWVVLITAYIVSWVATSHPPR